MRFERVKAPYQDGPLETMLFILQRLALGAEDRYLNPRSKGFARNSPGQRG